MMKIVLGARYHGHCAIDYEGRKISEPECLRAAKRLLQKMHEELA